MILLKDVAVKRGSRVLLSVPSLRLLGGKVTVILGANGAGKSTLLKVLAGSIKPDTGEVLLFGRRLTEWTAKKLAESRALLSQHYSLPFALSVRDLVALGRFPHGHSIDEGKMINAAMEEMQVMPFADRMVQSLSGGEQQRAHMARVLLQLKSHNSDGPRLLLLDEPVSSLDIVHQRSLLQKAREAAQAGYTVVVVLHDINLAADYADQYLLMKNGQIIDQTSVLSSRSLSAVYDIQMLEVSDASQERYYYFASGAR